MKQAIESILKDEVMVYVGNPYKDILVKRLMDRLMEKLENANVVLQGNYLAGEQISFKLSTGSTAYVTGPELAFLKVLHTLPAVDRGNIIGLTDEELTDIYLTEHKSLQQECLELLSKKWKHRDTGDPVYWNDAYLMQDIFELGIKTMTALKRKIRSGKMELAEMRKVIEVFEDENTQFYY